MRVAAVEAKGRDAQAEARANGDRCIEEKCEKAMRKREEAAEKRRQHEAREQEDKQAKADKQAAKQADSAAKKQRKADEQRERAQHKAEQKAKRAREKQRSHYIGGMAWGYDPNAGVSTLAVDSQTDRHKPRGGESESRTTSGTAGSVKGGSRYDRVTGEYFDSKWGIEVGGPDRSTPPGPHRDRFAKAMAEVDRTSRMDRGGLSRDPGSSQEALSDINEEVTERS